MASLGVVTRPRRKTNIQRTVSYVEPSSADSDSNLSIEYSGGQSPRRRSSRRAQAPPLKRLSPPTQKYETISRPATKKPRVAKPVTPKPSISAKPKLLELDSVGPRAIPPWQTLPYQILADVFNYAVQPLFDDHSFQPSPSVKWLLHIARLCRAFAEPALTVLYCSPPLVPMVQAHRLVDLFRKDPTTMAFGYRQKVRSLCIDVGQVAAYSLPGSGYLDLYNLIKDLPRLAELELYHQKDMSPYRNLDEHIKWTYPERIFDALEYVDPTADPIKGDKTSVCKLRSWRWSSRLAGKTWPLERIQEVHLMPSFENLRKVAFVNYQVPAAGLAKAGRTHEDLLADALRPLKNLDHLVFESSTLVNSKLLPQLPANLRHLELINCWEVVADDLAGFLLSHGSQVRSLKLNHNQSLNLSFLSILSTGCPNLQDLKMNLTYFNLHATYRDSEPNYDQLFLANQIPAWPSTLQSIELIQLRKWETDAAEMFFQSLLDSAATLPDLRKLTIQAILNIAWRDRASFREEWIGSLNRVFRRVSDPPQTHTFVPIRQGPSVRVEKREVFDLTVAHRGNPRATPAPQTASRRRTMRSCARNSRTGIYTQSPETSESESATLPQQIVPKKICKPALNREIQILKQTAGIDSSPPSSPTKSSSIGMDEAPLKKSGKGKGKGKETIQGMCEVVEVRIDNLRPTEIQVTEADFLDEEVSGDEDWNGDDDGISDGYAW